MDLSNTEVVVHYPNLSKEGYNARDLIKFTGAYLYYPELKESVLNENPLSSIEHKGIEFVREYHKKSPYKPYSNRLYRKVHKTLNLISRMYDSVYNQYSKQYPEIIRGNMPILRIQLLDKCFSHIEREYQRNGSLAYIINTESAYGNTYLNSTKINLQTKALDEFTPERVENLIMHELGHAIFGLNHCRKRKKKCPLMARYFYQRGEVTHSLNRRTFRKFIKNKYYKQQIKELREV